MSSLALTSLMLSGLAFPLVFSLSPSPDQLWVHLILVSHALESGNHVASHPIRLQTQHAHLPEPSHLVLAPEVGDHPQCPLLDFLQGILVPLLPGTPARDCVIQVMAYIHSTQCRA